MKAWTKLLAVLTIVSMVSVVGAADKPAKADKKATLKGSVVKVDGTNLLIKAGKKGEEKDVTVATDDKTVIMVDGKEAKLADLKEGQKVTISPETGTATKIEAKAAKPAKQK
jgi:hypothetical protein